MAKTIGYASSGSHRQSNVIKKVDVAKQPHYASFDIEPIDYMRAIMTDEMFEGYLQGNIIKYMSRYRLKNGIQDLEKADVYNGWLKEHLERRRYGVGYNK